jgi:hypothetical protein
MPSDETVCGAGQVAIAKLPAVHVNVTTTFVLFEPLPFGAGDAEALIDGGTARVKLTGLLATPDTVTTTLPVVAPLGTGTLMLLFVQVLATPGTPLKVTVLEGCGEPKPEPIIVTKAPIGAEDGLIDEIDGGPAL